MKLENKNKKLDMKYKIDLVVIFFSAIALMFVVGYAQPLVISPLNDFSTTETTVLFSIEKGDKLLIDDNIEFTTPEEYKVSDGLNLDFNPGQYYWKVIGVGKSEIRTFTINSKVSLELIENAESFDVVNSGNVGLLIDVYNGTELVEKTRLEVSEEMKVNGTKVLGEQNE